jgi:hypothetical protein
LVAVGVFWLRSASIYKFGRNYRGTEEVVRRRSKREGNFSCPSGSGEYELTFYQAVEGPAKLHYVITLLFSSGAPKDLQPK